MKHLYGPKLNINTSEILNISTSEYNSEISKNMYCAMIFVKKIMANGETLPQAIHRSAQFYKVKENELLNALCLYRTAKLKNW